MPTSNDIDDGNVCVCVILSSRFLPTANPYKIAQRRLSHQNIIIVII